MPDLYLTPTFKALSLLLTYPTEELVAAIPEIAAVLASEETIDREAHGKLAELLGELASQDLFVVQERYVELFDRARKLSLHLFEHVHGESRDRGQAMVDLARLYEKGGFTVSVRELPDYLPLFLEYLATRPLAEARALLANTSPILAVLQERLAKRQATYAAVFEVLLSISGAMETRPDEATPEEGDDLAALDAAWEETAVTFGHGDLGDVCARERLRRQLRAASRPARTANV